MPALVVNGDVNQLNLAFTGGDLVQPRLHLAFRQNRCPAAARLLPRKNICTPFCAFIIVGHRLDGWMSG